MLSLWNQLYSGGKNVEILQQNEEIYGREIIALGFSVSKKSPAESLKTEMNGRQ